jgi:DNA-binding NarL/FixJ family response regulator
VNQVGAKIPQPSSLVMLVDDAPQSLGHLCSALEDDGYTVVVAHDGASALQRLDLVTPDAILLDALMPGWSGFETCRRIKQDPALAHIPVIFMTGLSETTHIVEGFDSGGVDYVVKPVRAQEVLVRLATHVRNARAVRLAREAIDIGGHGVIVIDAQGRVAWRSPQAAAWLRAFGADQSGRLPHDWWSWLAARAADGRLPDEHVSTGDDGQTLVVKYLGPVGLGEEMLLVQPRAANALNNRLATAALTARETEVLSWIAKGKTNRDVGEILGLSHRTVNKHLEHVFEKLGVETRAAAAALASREMM